jgi:hypothetical protein
MLEKLPSEEVTEAGETSIGRSHRGWKNFHRKKSQRLEKLPSEEVTEAGETSIGRSDRGWRSFHWKK